MYRVNQYCPPEPPPRSPAPWIPAAVALGVCLVLSVAIGVSYLFSLRRAKATREAAVAASAKPPGAAESTLPSELHDDSPTPEPTTPSASLRARPRWSSIRGSDYAPQLGDALPVFLAAAPLAGNVDGGLVVCRVDSFNHADTFAGDDLQARMTLGVTPLVSADGPDNSNYAFVSAPLVTLRRDDPVDFEVYDRDLFDMELLTSKRIAYGGKGLTLHDTGSNIECRALEGGALDRQARHYGGVAARALTALAGAKLDARKHDWGWPAHRIDTCERAISDVAALVGWADARAASRAADVDTALARLESERASVFEQLQVSAGADASARDLHAHLDQIECGPNARACVARVTLRNDGPAPRALSSVSAYVAKAGTGPVAARVAAPDTTQIAPGATVAVTITPDASALDDAGALVGVCVSDACGVLSPLAP